VTDAACGKDPSAGRARVGWPGPVRRGPAAVAASHSGCGGQKGLNSNPVAVCLSLAMVVGWSRSFFLPVHARGSKAEEGAAQPPACLTESRKQATRRREKATPCSVLTRPCLARSLAWSEQGMNAS
jgi:hypothetical protein